VVVEVDGAIHGRLLQERDAVRDAWFGANHFDVMRFSGDRCWADPSDVADEIAKALGRG
jgi:very-short-patch-repair endonuclease